MGDPKECPYAKTTRCVIVSLALGDGGMPVEVERWQPKSGQDALPQSTTPRGSWECARTPRVGDGSPGRRALRLIPPDRRLPRLLAGFARGGSPACLERDFQPRASPIPEQQGAEDRPSGRDVSDFCRKLIAALAERYGTAAYFSRYTSGQLGAPAAGSSVREGDGQRGYGKGPGEMSRPPAFR